MKKCFTAVSIGLSLLVMMLLLQWSELFAVFELKTLDQRFKWFANPQNASKQLVLVTIDDASIEAYGRWPWPRDRHGYVVHYMKQAGAKAVVFDVLFLEPDEGSEEYDAVFAEQVKAAGNVFLPFVMTPTDENQPQSSEGSVQPQPPAGGKFPLAGLVDGAQGIGFINMFADSDGTVRRIPLLGYVSNRPYLQLGASVAQTHYAIDKVEIDGPRVRFGPVNVPLTPENEMLIKWHGRFNDQVYPAYPIAAILQSYVDIQEGRKPLLSQNLFKDKIVFVAATAAGLYDLRVTPVSAAEPGVMIHMAVLDNLLQRQFLRQTSSVVLILSLVLMCMGTACGYLLIYRKALKLCTVGCLAVGYVGMAIYAFASLDIWVELVTPLGAWFLTVSVTATVAYFTEGKQRRYLRTVFDKYMATDVVAELLRQPERIKLGGEKQEITLFFSDVAGFTTISEQLDPESLVKLLNEYLSVMTDVILYHRGNVNKYLGDGIMAFFGAPRRETQHATLACLAALDCQHQLGELQANWTAQGYPELITRIGVNSGPVVVGNMGSQARMEYTAMGDNVNLAARLEGANKYYGTSILIGPQTYSLVKNDVVAREIDALRVKGKQKAVLVYELLACQGELEVHMQQLVATFIEGLRHYKARDFFNAQSHFEAALDIDPVDGPSQVYLQRVQDYLRTPPAADWDGVYELRSK